MTDEIWVLAEIRDGRPTRTSKQMLNAAGALAAQKDLAPVAIVLGGEPYEATRHLAALWQLIESRGKPRAILAGAGANGLELMARLAARLLPGEAARFYLEIPPMRWPSLRNVVMKTLARLRWYAAEVIPLFLLASVVIWIGELTRLFQLALAALRPAVSAIGLPHAMADAFLFGFFRRDYGAARIFDAASSSSVISGVPLVVAMVTITLFVPCVAQFLVMARERGWRTGAAVAAVILPFAFGVGFVLNLVLTNLGVQI